MKRVRLKHGDQSHGYITLGVCLRRLRSAKVKSILTLLTHAIDRCPQFSIFLCIFARLFSNLVKTLVAIFLLRVPALVPRAVIAKPIFDIVLAQALLLESREALRVEPAAAIFSVASDPLLVCLTVLFTKLSLAFIAVRLLR